MTVKSIVRVMRWCAVTIPFALAAPVALADGIILDAFAPTSAGRGGVNIAHADNGAILLENPGSLVNIDSCVLFDIGSSFLINDLDYSDPQNSTNGRFSFPENPTAAPTIAYIRKCADDCWAVGLGIFTPAGFGTLVRQDSQFAGRQDYRSLAALVKILPAVSYKASDRLSVGASLGVAVNHAELEGPFVVQSGAFRGVPTVAHMNATDVAPTWALGLQYELSSRTTLGLAYTAETRFRMDKGEATLDVYGLAPGPIHSGFDLDLDFVYPQSLGLGVKHDLSERSRFSADVIWFDWSHAFDSLDMKFSDADNPAFAGLVIGNKVPLDWRDTVSLKLGYERFLTACQTLRLGYGYHPNPIPDRTLTSYIPAILEHEFSAGYSCCWGHCSLDLAYLFTFSATQEVGNSDIVGPGGGPGDFSDSSVKSQYHVIFAGFTIRY